MNKLDALRFPLDKNALIEASAGTGKTYTISNLYLRLVLGHNCQPLSVAQILILTFTNAATAELKDRILARIRKAWRDFVAGQSDDAFIQSLLSETNNREQAQQRLLIASQEMDLASVFTIHGFCQRVLTEHAFESGSAWQETLSLDDSALLKHASKDYWRVRVTHLPENTLRWLLKQWPVPESLVQQIRPVLFRDIGLQQPDELKHQWQQLQQRYNDEIQQARLWWQEARMSDVLREADLKANVKIAKAPFLASMDEFANGNIHSPDIFHLPDFGSDGWLALSPEKVSKARKKSSAEIDLQAFERFELLAELEVQLNSARYRYFFWDALLFVRQHLQTQKRQNAEMSPDDLLTRLYSALTTSKPAASAATSEIAPSQGELRSNALTRLLQEKYPVALVDEFQDTDETQFAIFRHLFSGTQGEVERAVASALIMIGDPKQAIYSFRGGDIHTYLQARQFVPEESRYTLSTNWRSQPALVSAVNRFFSDSQTGFMHQDMPFHAVSAGKTGKTITLNGENTVSLEVALLPDGQDKKGQPAARNWGSSSLDMAQVCANQIAHYLNDMKVDDKPLEAAHVCVLVRDRFEAELIQTALRQRAIDSVFLRKDSVLKSSVAYSLLLLLRAIAEFKSEGHIKAALLDSLFAYSHNELAQTNSDLAAWQNTLQWFAQAHDIWSRQGVMAALEFVFQRFELFSRIMERNVEHHRCITDLRHLSEILQFQSGRIDGKAPLIVWFEACIARPELLAAEGIEGTQWRLDTDQNLVQICTIHASKGLQYPVVMLPFVSRYKDNNSGFYHDEEGGLQYSIEDDDALKAKQQKERLAEDIRLFYVALTRAEYHCWLGCWNNALAPRSSSSGFALTAMGQLLDFTAQDNPYCEHIFARLDERLNGENIRIYQIEAADIEALVRVEQQCPEAPELIARQLASSIEQDWLLTSYSAISRTRQNQSHDIEAEDSLKAADESELVVALPQSFAEQPLLDSSAQTDMLAMRFRFTRGAAAGSYLHEVLEHCEFNNPASVASCCMEYADKYSVNQEDIPEIADWLVDTLQSSLAKLEPSSMDPLVTNSGTIARLWDIPAAQRLPEMEFYLPLNQVNVSQFNKLVKQWLPEMHGHYQLAQLNGMLKGYLDLIYIHQGRFYVADYKSNYLGDNLEDYNQEALQEAMLHHDYYLQALLYSVALHRYLSNKLSDYHYDTHVGGAQYLFLRGMSSQLPGNGVLTVTPPLALINQLDALFCGKEEAA